MHPEWLNLMAAMLHEVRQAYTDLPACVIVEPIRGQRRIYEELSTKYSHALFSCTEITPARQCIKFPLVVDIQMLKYTTQPSSWFSQGVSIHFCY